MDTFLKQILQLLLLLLLATNFLYSQTKPKILILHSYHPSYKWTHDVHKGVRTVFDDVTEVDLYVEYMDTKKYVDTEYFSTLLEIYTKKYQNITFDLILSSDDNAFEFLKKYNSSLFKNAPVVFAGTNYLEEKRLEGFSNFTGVNEKADIERNYELILKFHPNIENIYTVIDTTTTGSIVKKEVKEIIESYKNRDINFVIIDNVTKKELIEKVKNLPSESAILFTLFLRDKNGEFLEYYEGSQLVARASNVPVYGLWDFTLGHGIVGGFLTSGYFQGKTAAEIGKSILKGIDVESIPILFKSPNEYMFDYKYIKKFNIDESLIPLESIVINKKESLLENYFKEIITLVVVFIMMAIFIILLLVNIKKRKEAESIVKKQLSFQQNLIDNVNTPIYYKNLKREYIGCNKAFEELLGLPRSQILHRTASDIVAPKTAKFYHEKDDELLEDKKLQHYEDVLTLGNKRRDLAFYKNVFYEEGEVAGIVGAIFDVTEKNSLNYELNRLLLVFHKNVIASKTDVTGKLIYVSEAFCEISGYRESDLLGRKHNVVSSGMTDDDIYSELWKTISKNQIWMGEIVNKKKNGELYTLQTIITPEFDKFGEFLNYTSISQDISAQKLILQANAEIELLNDDIIDTQKEILFRLGAVAEARSKETGMHVKRVAEYSYLLALYYGLSKNESEIVKLASPMHDIGKIAIPDAILNKPGKYVPEEFEIMKTHAQIGYDMLKDSKKKILKAAAIIAHQHQEKYDGSGYPQGLKKEDIHIYGRITAVADVFDALGSDRVYKKAWEDEKIFAFFKEQSGKHFDPNLIDLFFKHLDEFLKIRDMFKDS